MAFVKVQELTKKFGSVIAVDNISFEVEKNELLTLLGPSGCGKTTTLRCIAGLEKPEHGEIYIRDRLVFSSQKKIFIPPDKRRLGIVFQSYAIWPHMTVFQNIAYPLVERKVRKQEIETRVRNILRLTGLEEFDQRYATFLSGGQQQRVALARSLVYNPVLLLLDEPLSNLDAKLRESMRVEIVELQKKVNITAIYVTHDQAEAMAISNRIVVMNEGKIVQLDSPQRIYSNPRNQFVAQFIGRSKLFSGQVAKQIPGSKYRLVKIKVGGQIYEMECNVPPSIKEGEKLTICVKDVNVDISRQPPEENKNIMKGEVSVSLFMGDYVDYKVLIGGEEIRVKGDPGEEFHRGDKVFVWVDPENWMIIPE